MLPSHLAGMLEVCPSTRATLRWSLLWALLWTELKKLMSTESADGLLG